MPMLSRLVRTAAAASLLAPAALAAQTNKPIVAILAFDNNSFDGLGKGIADMLITDMAANPKIRLVDRDRIQVVLAEQNLVKSGSVDPQTAVRLGRLLGAQYVIVGGFMNANGTMVLTGRTIDVETSETANPQRVQAKTDDVLGLVATLSAKLNNDIRLEPKPGRRVGDAGANAAPAGSPATTASAPTTMQSASAPAKTPAASVEKFARPLPPQSKPVRLDVATARIYSSALDEMDKKNPAKAAELFRQVVAKYPGFMPARENLTRLAKSGN